MGKIKGAVDINKEKCKGCELCIHACPHDVLKMSLTVNRKGLLYSNVVNADSCTGCSNCAIVCPDGVITVYRKKVE